MYPKPVEANVGAMPSVTRCRCLAVAVAVTLQRGIAVDNQCTVVAAVINRNGVISAAAMDNTDCIVERSVNGQRLITLTQKDLYDFKIVHRYPATEEFLIAVRTGQQFAGHLETGQRDSRVLYRRTANVGTVKQLADIGISIVSMENIQHVKIITLGRR